MCIRDSSHADGTSDFGMEIGSGCVPIVHKSDYWHLELNYGMLEVFEKDGCKGKSVDMYMAEKGNQPLKRCLYIGEVTWVSVKFSETEKTKWVAPK